MRALAGNGLWVDLGAATVRVRSNSTVFATQFQSVYGALPFVDRADWADVHIEIRRATGLRRWLRPQVVLWCDGQQPFEPFPADSPLPLFEWGCNWQVAHRLNHLLLLHAGTVERDGRALVLPAMPGSGKSTLTAALSQRGWRLLSDEFGAFDPVAGAFRALLKPIALKNQSIEVIRAFAPQARFGPEFPKTRKGRVSHLAATDDAAARRHETARPGAIVLPRWEAGSPTHWEPLAEHVAFPALAFNAFNYTVLGEVGFRAAVTLMRQCPAWQLVYSDLDDALATINAAWPAIVAEQAGGAR
ncbi:MAG: HprK-related kinase A [Rubrivivax sp.]|nr:HprK-related kinase A [Rubrivivax sp.]